MKIKIFLILNVLLLVGCCKKVSLNPQTGLPWGWNPMPHERIKSYFPLNVGTQVAYIYRKKGKTRCLSVLTYIITTKILLEIVMVCLVNLFLMKIVMPLLI